jgi:predicted O-methyltransferase YrrM
VSRLFIVKQYIKYFFKAKNLHGIHSPFIYSFNEQVLNDSRKFYVFEQIENLRKVLLRDNTAIEVQDFGAGSLKKTNNIRIVKNIAANAGRTKKYGELLFKIVAYYKSNNILELGTSLGIGASYVCLANPKAAFTTIEGSAEIATKAAENFISLGINNVKHIIGNFNEELPIICKHNAPFDLIIIDGNHQYEATKNYFEILKNNIATEAIIIFDDIHWSQGMQQAWTEILKSDLIFTSVDVFQFGILFFSKNFTTKQHFVLRY